MADNQWAFVIDTNIDSIIILLENIDDYIKLKYTLKYRNVKTMIVLIWIKLYLINLN